MKPRKKHIWIDNVAARIVLYIAMLATGYLVIIYLHDAIQGLQPGKLYYEEILVSAIVITILALPVVSIRRFLRDKNSFRQSRRISQQHSEVRYTGALHLLFKRNNKQSNVLGLKELMRLRQEGLIDTTHIDTMTVELDLAGAPVNAANLQEANLPKANLRKANLRKANLRKANLEGANLEGANLEGTNLEGTNLEGANLEGTNLEGTNLHETNLQGANLEGVKNLDPDMLRKAKNWREAILDPSLRQQIEQMENQGDQASRGSGA